MVAIEISSSHSYSTSIHTIGLSCTVWPQYATRKTDDRMTDRAMGKGHLCYSIGGPKNVVCKSNGSSSYIKMFSSTFCSNWLTVDLALAKRFDYRYEQVVYLFVHPFVCGQKRTAPKRCKIGLLWAPKWNKIIESGFRMVPFLTTKPPLTTISN